MIHTCLLLHTQNHHLPPWHRRSWFPICPCTQILIMQYYSLEKHAHPLLCTHACMPAPIYRRGNLNPYLPPVLLLSGGCLSAVSTHMPARITDHLSHYTFLFTQSWTGWDVKAQKASQPLDPILPGSFCYRAFPTLVGSGRFPNSPAFPMSLFFRRPDLYDPPKKWRCVCLGLV